MKRNKLVTLTLILTIAIILQTNMAYAATKITISTPTNLKTTSSSYNSAKMSWGKVKNADGYRIYRATSSKGTYSSIKLTTSTSYTNTGLTTGKTYYYKVKAYKNSGTKKVYSKYSSAVSVKPVPSTVTNLKAVSSGYNSTKLTWSKVNGASGYQVYRATSSKGTYSLVKTTPYISYNNIKLTTGKTYHYKVRAYRTVGTKKVYGKYSSIKSAKPVPATPTNFKGTSISEAGNKVSWSAVTGASSYQVSRATSLHGTYRSIKTTTAIAFTDTGLESATTYYYKVRAYKTVGTTKIYSKFTSVIAVTTSGFDTSISLKNITAEYKDIEKGVIAVLTNNNNYPVSISATAVFYDEAGAMIGKSTDDNYYFEAGKQCSLYFYGPYDGNYDNIPYSTYKITYSIENVLNNVKSNLSDIEVKSNVATDKVMVEVTNSGSKTSEFTQVGIIFYKNGQAVGYDYQYADCETPGSVSYLEFMYPYDENYDTIAIDHYEIYVNSSYSYTW